MIDFFLFLDRTAYAKVQTSTLFNLLLRDWSRDTSAVHQVQAPILARARQHLRQCMVTTSTFGGTMASGILLFTHPVPFRVRRLRFACLSPTSSSQPCWMSDKLWFEFEVDSAILLLRYGTRMLSIRRHIYAEYEYVPVFYACGNP